MFLFRLTTTDFSTDDVILVYLGQTMAGVRGSRTGVYIGVGIEEAMIHHSTDPETVEGDSLPGCYRAFFANKVSWFFDFKGELYVL